MKKILFFALLCTFSLATTAQINLPKKDKIGNKRKGKTSKANPKLTINIEDKIPLISDKLVRIKNKKIKTITKNGKTIVDGQTIDHEIQLDREILLDARNTFNNKAYLVSRNTLNGFSNTITLERNKGFMDIYFPNNRTDETYLVEISVQSRRSSTLKTQHPRTYETSTFQIRGNNQTQIIRFLFHSTGDKRIQIMSDNGVFDIKGIRLRKADLEVF